MAFLAQGPFVLSIGHKNYLTKEISDLVHILLFIDATILVYESFMQVYNIISKP